MADMSAPGFCRRVLIAETGPVTERLRVRGTDDDEGRRLVRIIRRGSGSVVTWRRAQMVLLSAQGMDATAIAKVAFTSEDRERDVIRNFNADGFSSLYPKYKGGRPPKSTRPSGERSRRSPRPSRQRVSRGQAHRPPVGWAARRGVCRGRSELHVTRLGLPARFP
jgi:hypothetical protein